MNVPENAEDVVIECCYQLGVSGFSNFKKTIEYLMQKDFENAAIEIAQKYNIKNCIITRGGNGLTCYDSKKTFNIKIRLDLYIAIIVFIECY